MHTVQNLRGPSLPDAALPRDLDRVLAVALELQGAQPRPARAARLRGKNLGLLSRRADSAAAALFTRAATELGAHVVHIRPDFAEPGGPHGIEETARVLGLLYDAVECQGVAPDVVAQVAVGARVPVYDGLATARHPSAALVDRLPRSATAADRRRAVLQAWLITSID